MPELRQSLFTKEWVVIATERAKRSRTADRAPGATDTGIAFPELPLLSGHRGPDATRSVAPAQQRRYMEGARHPQQVCRTRARSSACSHDSPLSSYDPGLRVHDVIVETPAIPSPWRSCPTATWQTCYAFIRLATMS